MTTSSLAPKPVDKTGLSMLGALVERSGAKRPLSSAISEKYVCAPAENLDIVVYRCLSRETRVCLVVPSPDQYRRHPHKRVSSNKKPGGWMIRWLATRTPVWATAPELDIKAQDSTTETG
jgi:hypothetical protein